MAGAMEYLTIILIGIPFTMAYNMEAAMLQAVGNSMTPLLFLLFSSVLNISLDYAFMAPLAMGIGGAAFATVLSQGVSAFLAFILIWRNYPLLHFKGKDYQVEKKFVLEMVVAGFSMALMSAIYNIGSVILQGSINALGNLYITAQVGARRLVGTFPYAGTCAWNECCNLYKPEHGWRKSKQNQKRSMVSILSFCGLVDFFHGFCDFLRGRCRQNW